MADDALLGNVLISSLWRLHLLLFGCLFDYKTFMFIIIAKSLIYKGILLSLNFCEETFQPKRKLFYIVTLSSFFMGLSWRPNWSYYLKNFHYFSKFCFHRSLPGLTKGHFLSKWKTHIANGLFLTDSSSLKHGKVSPDDLPLIACDVVSCWKRFGRVLLLEERQLQQIEADEQKQIEKSYGMYGGVWMMC